MHTPPLRRRAWHRIALTLALVVGAAALAACAPAPAPPAARPDAAAAAPAGPASAGSGSAASAPAASPQKIVFALAAVSGVFIPPVLAEQKGFFREEGLVVDLPVTRPNLLSPGLAVGEIDYAGSFSPAVRNGLSGLPVKVVAATVNKSTRRIMTVPGIQSMAQLRGASIAIVALGDGPYNSGVLAVEAFGLNPDTDVTWLAVGGAAERVLALQQGYAQATIFSGSEVPRAEALGFPTLLRLDEVAPLPESGVSTSIAKLENDPAQVKRVLRAVVRALQYVKSDREGSLPAYMQFLGLSREEALEAYDAMAYAYSDDGTLSERSMRFTIEAEKKQLGITEEVPFSRIADFRPLYEILPELNLTPPPDAAR